MASPDPFIQQLLAAMAAGHLTPDEFAQRVNLSQLRGQGADPGISGPADTSAVGAETDALVSDAAGTPAKLGRLQGALGYDPLAAVKGLLGKGNDLLPGDATMLGTGLAGGAGYMAGDLLGPLVDHFVTQTGIEHAIATGNTRQYQKLSVKKDEINDALKFGGLGAGVGASFAGPVGGLVGGLLGAAGGGLFGMIEGPKAHKTIPAAKATASPTAASGATSPASPISLQALQDLVASAGKAEAPYVQDMKATENNLNQQLQGEMSKLPQGFQAQAQAQQQMQHALVQQLADSQVGMAMSAPYQYALASLPYKYNAGSTISPATIPQLLGNTGTTPTV